MPQSQEVRCVRMSSSPASLDLVLLSFFASFLSLLPQSLLSNTPSPLLSNTESDSIDSP